MTDKFIEDAKKFREWHFTKGKGYFYGASIMIEFLNGEQYRVYSYISRFFQMNGYCYFKYDEMARRFKISKTKISEALMNLRSLGIIIKNFGVGGNNFYYTISDEAIDKIIDITNKHADILPGDIRIELAGVNLNAVDMEYLERLIEKKFPEESAGSDNTKRIDLF